MEATGTNLHTLDLPSSTLSERQAHAELLLNLEAKKIASTIDVPTLPHEIQSSLRTVGQPIRLFGENNANVRDRLRMCLARIEVEKKAGGVSASMDMDIDMDNEEGGRDTPHGTMKQRQDVKEVQYTRADEDLSQARKLIAEYSISRARDRLRTERKRKLGSQLKDRTHVGSHKIVDQDEATVIKDLDHLNDCCQERYNCIKEMALEGSQYGDGRPLSAIATGRQPNVSTDPCLIATGGWTGGIKLWNGSSSALELLSTKQTAHEDRIMSVAMHQGNTCQLATASIDLTGKLWKVNKNNDVDMGSNNTENGGYGIEEMAVLKGHAARLCKIAYHPSGRFVGTTSFDHTFRLWDIEAGGKELLLQDGHWKEVFGIGFHGDGSLVSTTDFGGVVQVWDLRSGKSACHFLGHAKRVLCTEFSPDGFQLASAGDDGTIKVWDLRQRKQYASIPAHSRLVTQIKFAHDHYGQNGEYLTSCSFDGTAKVWSTRNWELLSTLRGHEGKVMGVDVLDGTDAGIVTCGYDKTMKIWR
eukprot:scaffold654_cov253-Chaetoceros_neogracile.AAC.9